MLKLGVDAFEFLLDIPDEIWELIDTVVLDPPYFDDDNKKHIERVNQRSRLKDRQVLFDKQFTRIMNREHRENILQYIKDKTGDIHIIHFHMIREKLKINPENVACEHVWVKPIKLTIAGNNDRNNGELIVIEGKKLEGKIPGRILNKYINADFGGKLAPRANAKPVFLFTELYRHLDSKFILDPFAGYGNPIRAAYNMNIPIYACDIDTSINWDIHKRIHQKAKF